MAYSLSYRPMENEVEEDARIISNSGVEIENDDILCNHFVNERPEIFGLSSKYLAIFQLKLIGELVFKIVG